MLAGVRAAGDQAAGESGRRGDEVGQRAGSPRASRLIRRSITKRASRRSSSWRLR